jgi:hypothetical protein
MSTLVASVAPSYLETVGGKSVALTLSVANTSDVIDAYALRVYGLDSTWVIAEPARLSLFPGDIGQIHLELSVPQDYPAGLRQISVHVQSENTPTEFALATLTLHIADRPLVSIVLDPSLVTGGSTAQFGMVIANRGNASVEVVADAVDPEELATFEFLPATMLLQPGEQQVVQARVECKRPWVGAPKVRVLTFRATAVGRAESIGTFVQKPRIGRWLLSLLGLMAAAAVFAAVISRTLSNVVDEASVSADVVNAALDKGPTAGQIVSLQPATLTGTVVTAAGDGIAGVQAELYRADDGTVPIGSAATADDGSFAFGRLSEGSYRIRFIGAGFTDLWYDSGRVFAEAKEIELSKGKLLPLEAMVFDGRPGTVSGRVIAADPVGTTITILSLRGLAPNAPPAVVDTVDVSADGSFTLVGIPSPATYTLVAERPGSAAETRSIVLSAGDAVEDVEIVLRPGDGVISGKITVDGVGAGGITVTATDGTNVVSTVSLTQAAVAPAVGEVGSYVIRNLATPGVYTITVTRDGLLPQTRTISLAAAGSASANWALLPAIGSISGRVFTSGGQGVGSVVVSLSGGDVVRATRSLGVASGATPAGSYVFESLPAPGTYTLTFSLDGLVSQVRLVNVGGDSPGTINDINVVMSSSKALIRGVVRDAGNNPVAVSKLELTNGVSTRVLYSADEPLGEYTFANLDPGTYTLTANLSGSAAPVVKLVSVQAGDALVQSLTLGPLASLKGLVLNPDDTPAPGLHVRLFKASNPTVEVDFTTTLADGSYSFLAVEGDVDFIVKVYASPVSPDVIDSELAVSVPGLEVVVGNLVNV